MNEELQKRVLLVGIKCPCLGDSLKDDVATGEVTEQYEAKEGAMRVMKTRLKAGTKAIRNHQGNFRKWFREDATLPGISRDLRMCPSERVERMIRPKVAEAAAKLAQLVTVLQSRYDEFKNIDKGLLGTRYDASLYPPVEDLPSHFGIVLTVCDLPRGEYDRITGLNAAERERMRREHEAMMVQVSVAARNQVQKKMAELIQAIADKLTDPNAKQFHESTFDKLREYLDQVPELNVSNDPQLEAMRQEAMQHLNLSMEQVKNSALLKEQAVTAAKSILNKYGMPVRKIIT